MSMSVEVMTKVDNQTIKDLFAAEQSSYPLIMQSGSEGNLKKSLEFTGALTILLRQATGQAIGCISAFPLRDVYEGLQAVDPEISLDEKVLYVWSFVIVPEARGDLSLVFSMIRTFIGEARQMDYRKITMHAPIDNSLSVILQRRYSAKRLHRVHWSNSYGESAWHYDIKRDYLEISLDHLFVDPPR